ncbi:MULTISPECIES: major capsid protein [Pontibacillus]|uniref:Major capsid protein n=1 Tax=Pontibacillus chungwhensis TaxID=265426 RepID=A0ABY8UYI7_9BACI|nr:MULTISPECIES: major capsid protein [Pontibacillus]MCD5324770.1 major capsid protein [Pontibacillus sp. HN14]WIF98730.1 major capsid protein [Pontibacillus chungwhensis]
MPPVDIYSTRTMLSAISQMKPARTFLMDTFFPNFETKVTEKVDVDFKKGKRKMAPFVSPRVGGKVVERQGFQTYTYAVPKIAPERVMTSDDITRRSMGEGLYSAKTPAQRAVELMATDIMDLDDLITRREEWMCREVLFGGKVLMVGDGIEQEVDYNFTNKETLSTGSKWNEGTSEKLADLKRWRLQVIQKTGKAPNVCIMESSVVDDFLADKDVRELMDLQRLNVGAIEPSIQNEAVTFIGRLSSLGIEIYSYDEWYLDENDEEQPMVPVGHVLLGSRGMNKRLYGAVTQIEDNSFVTIEGTRVPKSWIDNKNEVRMMRLSARPLPVPVDVDSWYVAKVK